MWSFAWRGIRMNSGSQPYFFCLFSFHAFILFLSLQFLFVFSVFITFPPSSSIRVLCSFPPSFLLFFHFPFLSFIHSCLLTYSFFPVFHSLSSLPPTSLFIPVFLRPSFYSLSPFSFSSYPPLYFFILLLYFPLFP
jgi:hypothetical protein